MCEEYTFTADLVFRCGAVTEEAIINFCDKLYDVSYDHADNIDFSHRPDIDQYTVHINEAIYEGNEFEYALIDTEMLCLMADCEFECSGPGQKFFYRIQDGQLQQCSSVQVPDQRWKRVDLMLRHNVMVVA